MYVAAGYVLHNITHIVPDTTEEFSGEAIHLGSIRVIRVSDLATVFEGPGAVSSFMLPTWAAAGFLFQRKLMARVSGWDGDEKDDLVCEWQHLAPDRLGAWASSSIGHPDFWDSPIPPGSRRHPIFPLWAHEAQAGLALTDARGTTLWVIEWKLVEMHTELDILEGDDFDRGQNQLFRWSPAGCSLRCYNVTFVW